MQAVSADIYLGSAVSRESLLRACRLLAERLSYRLERQGLVWQHLAVRVDLEGASLFLARQFSRTQTPKSLGLHLERIILDLQVESPVEKITVTLDWLSQAPSSQLTLFSDQDPQRESRLLKAVAAASRIRSGVITTASALAPTRRELMLAFYDPWRRYAHGTKDPGVLE